MLDRKLEEYVNVEEKEERWSDRERYRWYNRGER